MSLFLLFLFTIVVIDNKGKIGREPPGQLTQASLQAFYHKKTSSAEQERCLRQPVQPEHVSHWHGLVGGRRCKWA